MVQAELFSGLKAHKGVSRPTLKIKCYWLQSEAVTFHWDGIYYSEEEGTKYYAVCLQGQKKHPLLIKTLFWDGGFDFNWWVIPVFFFFFKSVSQKMRFFKKHFLKQNLPLLGFLSSDREASWMVISTGQKLPQFAWKILWDKIRNHQVSGSSGKSNLNTVFMI